MNDYFLFRGTKYRKTGGRVPLKDLSNLYLIYKALEGDQLAKDLLDAAGTIITDYDGNQIYPQVTK